MSDGFSNDQMQALKRALYSSSDVQPQLRGREFLNADFDLEDRLRMLDFSGHFRVYAQDDEEQATHYTWAGCVDGFGLDLEVQRMGDSCWVVVHDVHTSEAARSFVSDRRNSSFVM